jgi:hypothetical protein
MTLPVADAAAASDLEGVYILIIIVWGGGGE